MARPRYTAAKRAREQKLKERREAKLARRHARARSLASEGTVPPSSPGTAEDTASDESGLHQAKPDSRT
jgi:hypothetical protein